MKLDKFMEAYHAPYRPEYRYWTGLLLFARVVINIAIALSVNKKQYTLFTICIVVAFLFLLKAYLGSRLYRKKFLDYFESTCYFNLILFSVALFYTQESLQGQKASAYISISIMFVMFQMSYSTTSTVI